MNESDILSQLLERPHLRPLALHSPWVSRALLVRPEVYQQLLAQPTLFCSMECAQQRQRWQRALLEALSSHPLALCSRCWGTGFVLEPALLPCPTCFPARFIYWFCPRCSTTHLISSSPTSPSASASCRYHCKRCGWDAADPSTAMSPGHPPACRCLDAASATLAREMQTGLRH